MTVKMVTIGRELQHPRGERARPGCRRLILLDAGRRAGRGLHLHQDLPSRRRLHSSSHRRGPCPSAPACFGTCLERTEKAPLARSLNVFECVSASVWWVFEAVVRAPCDGNRLAVLSGA